MEQNEAPDPAMRPVMKHRLSTSPSVGWGFISADDSSNITDGWTREVHRRVSSIDNPQEMIDKQFSGMHHSTGDPIQSLSQHISLSSENSSYVLTSPTKQVNITKLETHDGNVQKQELESTDGVVVSDRMDMILQKGKKRATIINDSERFHAITLQPQPLKPQTPRQLLALRVIFNLRYFILLYM